MKERGKDKGGGATVDVEGDLVGMFQIESHAKPQFRSIGTGRFHLEKATSKRQSTR